MDYRKGNRVHFVCPVDVSFKDQSFEAMTENISLDGIFIKTDHQVAAGNRGTVCVKKEKTIFVCANCVVVLNDHDGLGIQFKSLDYDSFAHIKALVYRHQPHIQ